MRKSSISFFDLVLVGGGHAHLAVLESFVKKTVPGLRCCLISLGSRSIYSGMLPGWMAGLFESDEIQIDVSVLAAAAGITFLLDEVVGLDAGRKCLQLRSGRTIGFGKLSLATGGETDLSHLAMLGDRLHGAKPIDHFFSSWPMVKRTIDNKENCYLAVVGGGAAGCELVLAVRAAVRKKTKILLVIGARGLLAEFPARTRRSMEAALRAADVELVEYQAVGCPDGLLLAEGSRIACDVVIAATGTRPPSWISETGLALSQEGYVIVDAAMRSISNKDIFAAGDLSIRTDRIVERSGVHAVKSGPVLAHNLRAQFENLPLRRYRPLRRSLYIISTSNEEAILSWRGFTLGGRLAWWIKKKIDQGFVNRYSLPTN